MTISKSKKNYLLKNQYKNVDNLNKRINIHKLFSTNKYGWHKWVFQQLKLPKKSKILELGSGPGLLWTENLNKIPKGLDITLSDFSPGMLKQTKNNLKRKKLFKFKVINAQSIPFKESTFDVIIANHMLYHLPNLNKGLKEIKRVLKPYGVLYAATNGENNLKEIREIKKKFKLKRYKGFDNGGIFKLENGEKKLSKYFSKIKLSRYQDSLIVTEVNPLITYIQSATEPFTDAISSKIDQYLKEKIKLHKAINITKDSGIFIAHN